MSGPVDGDGRLSDRPRTDGPELDLLVTGTVFLDLIFTGLPAAPVGGREIMAEGMGSSPGGAANMAVAAARLGLATGLSAVFGTDVYGDYCWSTLEEDEGIDLSWSHRLSEWHSPVTVSLAYDDDRAMVTHAHAPAVAPERPDGVPTARACFADVGSARAAWVDRLIDAGSMVFADVGWDRSGTWDAAALRSRLEGCHAFVPNASEAMAYTRTTHPGAALEVLRDWVPLAVVTAGSSGAYAADERTGETVWVPGLPSPAVDPTGAGDVFLAALVLGTLQGWPLQQRIRFANLAAALSVRDLGGALAAPGWADICDWWSDVDPGSRLARDYHFLEDLLTHHEHRVFARALPTIGFVSTAHDHSRHGPRPTHRAPVAPAFGHPVSPTGSPRTTQPQHQPATVTSQERP